MRKAIGQFTEPLAARGIPWAVTYGNHDFQCGLSNAELDGIYREFPGLCQSADVRPCRTRLHIPVERVALCRRRLVPLAPVRGLPRRLIRWASLTMLVPMLLCLLLCLPPHPQWVPVNPGTFALPGYGR